MIIMIVQQYLLKEASLLKIAPHLILTLTNRSSSKCSYSLLMSSDYERSSWKDMILGLQSRGSYHHHYHTLTLHLPPYIIPQLLH